MGSKISVSEDMPVSAAASEQISISVEVNETVYNAVVASDLPLATFLREALGLTGTKLGCETGQCGSCVVLADGISVKSCAMLAAQADGARITTIEGLAPSGSLNPLQTCFWEQHAVQCGYCTPGMVLSLTDLLARNAHPSEAEIRRWMDGNMCRCGVYQNAVRAVQALTGPPAT
jgi:carbon-monoxide dehydrogenase small subunit